MSASGEYREQRSQQPSTHTTMCVTKRSGSREPVDVNKIVRAVDRCETSKEAAMTVGFTHAAVAIYKSTPTDP